MSKIELTTIGRTANAHFPSDKIRNVPVKIDTGADTSSIWVSELFVDDSHELSFVLFAKGSPYYSGKRHRTRHFAVSVIRSSNGTRQIRYRVYLTIEIARRRVRGSFSLADRSRNRYPVLIGCTLLRRKFIVDVSRGTYVQGKMNEIHEEFEKDPRSFFVKYHSDNQRGDVDI